MTLGLSLFAVLIVLIFLGVPVALSMALAGVIGLLIFGGPDILVEGGRAAWWILYNWALVTVPLFVLMAEIMTKGGLASVLFDGLSRVGSGVRGVLAWAAIMGNALMGLTTGSGIAEVAAMGRIAVPEMLKRGYALKLALGAVTASGALGFIVPPGIFLILYGAWAGVPIGHLFAGSLIPGFMLAFLMIGSTIIQTTLNPKLAPITPAQPMKARAQGLLTTWPMVLLGGLILGLIFTGIATPVEASGVAVLMALLIIYLRPSSRKMVTYGNLKEAVVNTTRFTSVIMLIAAGAAILNKSWLYLGFATSVAQWMTSLPVPGIVVVMMIFLLILMLGCIMDPIAMMLMTMPVFLPIMQNLGYEPVWFGVVWGVLIACADITPPVGFALFTTKTVFPEYEFGTIIRGVLPFLAAELSLLVILTVFPGITLWLPGIIYG